MKESKFEEKKDRSLEVDWSTWTFGHDAACSRSCSAHFPRVPSYTCVAFNLLQNQPSGCSYANLSQLCPSPLPSFPSLETTRPTSACLAPTRTLRPPRPARLPRLLPTCTRPRPKAATRNREEPGRELSRGEGQGEATLPLGATNSLAAMACLQGLLATR